MDEFQVFQVFAGLFPSPDEVTIVLGDPRDDIPSWWRKMKGLEDHVFRLEAEARESERGTRARWIRNGTP